MKVVMLLCFDRPKSRNTYWFVERLSGLWSLSQIQGHVLSESDAAWRGGVGAMCCRCRAAGSCYSGAGGRLNNHQAAGKEEEQVSVE